MVQTTAALLVFLGVALWYSARWAKGAGPGNRPLLDMRVYGALFILGLLLVYLWH